MRSGTHIPQKARIPLRLWWCVGCILMLSVGCNLKGFECQSEQDCGKAQICENGWCRTPAPTVPTLCQPGVSRKCPSTKSIFSICKFGTQRCTEEGAWGTCQGVVLGQPETCNRVDDNCDGEIDEGLDCGCTTGAKRTCPTKLPQRGRCQPGFQRCAADGKWGTCEQQVKPRPELCNGQDDDCDGQTDEDASGKALTQACYSGPKNSAGTGRCKAGKQACKSGTWGACLGQTLPTPELCNGIDDDCNGKVDEPCEPCAPNHLVGHIGAPYDHKVDRVAWSPNGNLLVAAASSGTLQLWQSPQNKYLRSILTKAPLSATAPIVISQDSRYVAVATNNHTIEVWTLPHGTRYATLQGHTQSVTEIAFHPDGAQLLSLSTEAHEMHIWSLRTGTLQKRILTDAMYPWDKVAISPSGKRLVTTSRSHAILGIWEFASSRSEQLFEGCNSGHLGALFRNPDQVITLCQGSERNKAKLQTWALSRGTRTRSKELALHHIARASLHQMPQNKALLLGISSSTKLPTLVDVDSGVTLQEFDLPRQQQGTRHLRNATLSSNGHFILGSSGDARLWLWRVGDRQPAGALHKELPRHQSAVHSLTVHPQGQLLATSSLQEEAIRLWHIQPGKPNFGKAAGELRSASGAGGLLAFSPDGKWLASTDIYHQIVVWDMETSTVLTTLSKHGQPISQLLFSPDGTQLISVSRKGQSAILWSLPEGRFVRYISHQPLSNIAIHPSGKLLALGLKQHIEIVSLADPTLPPQASYRMATAESLVWMLFHPKGQELLFADVNIQAWTWKTSKTTRPLSKLLPHHLRALHPAGSLLALGHGERRSLNFIKPLKGTSVGELHLESNTPQMTGIAFGYAPHQLITAHENGWVRAWGCPTGGQP